MKLKLIERMGLLTKPKVRVTSAEQVKELNGDASKPAPPPVHLLILDDGRVMVMPEGMDKSMLWTAEAVAREKPLQEVFNSSRVSPMLYFIGGAILSAVIMGAAFYLGKR